MNIQSVRLVVLLAVMLGITALTGGPAGAERAATAVSVNVSLEGVWALSGTVNDITLVGKEAVVSWYRDEAAPAEGYLSQVDITNPASPKEIISERLPAVYDEVFQASYADTNFLYAAEDEVNGDSPQIQVYRKGDGLLHCFRPAKGKRVIELWAGGSYFFSAESDDEIAADNGLFVFKADPIAPYNYCTQIEHLPTNSEVTSAAGVGSYAYLGTVDGRLWIFDLSDPLFPAQKSNVDFFDGAISAIAAEGDRAYIASGNEVKIINVAQATTPVEVSSYTTPDPARQMAAEGGYLYILTADGLDIMDVRDGEQVSLVGYYVDAANGRFGEALHLAGDLIYTGGSQGMNILRFTEADGEPGLYLQPNGPGLFLNGEAVSYPCNLPGSQGDSTGSVKNAPCPPLKEGQQIKATAPVSAECKIECAKGIIEVVKLLFPLDPSNAAIFEANFLVRSILLSAYCIGPNTPALGNTMAEEPDILLELEQGLIRLEGLVSPLLALDIQTDSATVHSIGLNDFGVFHNPEREFSKITCYTGQVTVDPANETLTPVTLSSGQQVVVSENAIGPVTSIGFDTYMPMVVGSGGGNPGDDWQTILAEDFEGTFPGPWDVFDNRPGSGEYYWAPRSCRSFSGSSSGWVVGGGADGSTLPCDAVYPQNVNSWMIYGPFSLADTTAAEMSFQKWVNSASEQDILFWGASTDGINFNGWQQWGDTDGWQEAALDLANVPGVGDLRGKTAVWVALAFISEGGTGAAEGATVDDILLRKRGP